MEYQLGWLPETGVPKRLRGLRVVVKRGATARAVIYAGHTVETREQMFFAPHIIELASDSVVESVGYATKSQEFVTLDGVYAVPVVKK